MCKLSFVMPVFNAQVYLAEAIRGVLNQTVKDIELIIVNDCSTDRSLTIAKYYKDIDDRIRIIDLKENGGMSNARNVGNKKAKSKIIALQDADDVSLPERAETIIKFFEKHKDVSMFYSAYAVIDKHNNEGGIFEADKFDINNVFEKGYTMIGHPTVAYKKKVIVDNPYENGECSRLGFEDFRMMTNLWKKGHKFGHKNTPLVMYRIHDASSTQTRDVNKVNEIKKDIIKELKGADYGSTKDTISTN